MMSPGDVLLMCRDCKQSFTFSDEERIDFARHGLAHAPSRCQDCRAQRKSRQEEIGGLRPAPSFRDRRESISTLTRTTCGACGKVATVPFVPRENQVTYCSPCYEQRREAGRR
jgi:CxxC-x17-CxxC domain-containing protein